MKDGFVWCPHCRRPHLLTERVCTNTGRAIDRKLHRLTEVKHPIIGTILGGKYEILEPIARGGVGVIFEAEDRILHRRVAIKIVTDPHAGNAALRLEREAVVVAGINHVNVCVVFDIGRLPDNSDLPYVVMERLHGETLAERLRRDGPLDPPLAVEVMLQVLSGLGAAHARQVIHRDLKPSNLFLVHRAPKRPPLVKLLDFGYAKDLSRSAKSGSQLTSPGLAIGTPRYMAPEIVKGGRGSIASDVFACGVVLYEMLSGRHAWAGNTPVEVADSILNGEIPDLRKVSKHPISSELERFVLRAMAKKPERRFASVREMRRTLSAASKIRLHPGDSRQLPRFVPEDRIEREDSAPSSSSSSG